MIGKEVICSFPMTVLMVLSLKLERIGKIEISDDGVVTAQAGVSLAYMASRLASKGLKGFAFAGGIQEH